MKKVFSLIGAILVATLCLTGCGNSNSISENNNSANTTSTNKKIKGNCEAVECIKKISPENTVEQINEIIGFKGELTDEKYNKYYWEITDDTGVEVSYYSSKKGQIRIDYDKAALANSKVNFSRYNELEPKIKEGIEYKDFISYIGNVDGIVVEKSSYSTKYIWVDKDGGYITGSFSASSGKCTFAGGRI